MKTPLGKILAAVCLLSFGLTSPLFGTTYSYSDIQVPGAIGTSPSGINKNGDVVGYYQNSSGVFGFLLSKGNYTTINCPAATTGTYAVGINARGIIVGYYTTIYKSYGFRYVNGQCKILPTFNGSAPFPSGINDLGVIVGTYNVAVDVNHGFEFQNGKYTDISVPNSTQTIPFGINRRGDISGAYFDAAGIHGFVLQNGSYQTIDIPGSTANTAGAGLNDRDFVVGHYEDPALQAFEGFIVKGTNFQELIVPGGVTTFPSAVNDSNVIVGNYFNGGVNPVGFMATPSTE